ncbi:MAG: hypothetical protein R3C45_05665 [Phycisphaerales bacterium]
MLIAVLGVAGLGLLVDRVVIGSDMTGPAESSAGVLDDVSVDAESLLIVPDKPGNTGQGIAVPAESLASRLRGVAGNAATTGGAARDAFAVPPSWVPADAEPVAGSEAAQAVETFKRDHKLEAVLVTGDQRCAVVNGQTMYVGQSLQGYRLVSVQERSAEFRSGGVVITLGLRGAGQTP